VALFCSNARKESVNQCFLAWHATFEVLLHIAVACTQSSVSAAQSKTRFHKQSYDVITGMTVGVDSVAYVCRSVSCRPLPIQPSTLRPNARGSWAASMPATKHTGVWALCWRCDYPSLMPVSFKGSYLEISAFPPSPQGYSFFACRRTH
jgi:hypothetical protein